MNPTLKRILLIVLLFSVAALLAFGLYYLFTKSAPGAAPEAIKTPGGAGGQLPNAGERQPGAEGEIGQEQTGVLPAGNELTAPSAPSFYKPEAVTKISSDNAAFPSLAQNGNLRYHNLADGKFYTVGADGTVKPMGGDVFYNVQNVTWAKTANKAILEYPDGAKIVYNFDTKKQVTLPKHWQDFSFSPESSEIVAKSIGLSPDNRWLVVTKDDGTETRLIEPLGDKADRVTVDWSPSRQALALSRTGQAQGGERQEVLFIGMNGENFKSTVVEGLDFKPQWSPTGKKLLYSVDSARSDFKPELWIVNSYGDDIGSARQSLKINTWADKCSFADDTTLFCAVPRDLPQGAGMSRDIANSTPDDIVKIDLRSGLRTTVPMGNDNHTVDSISFDAKHNKVFFTDHNQSGVFEVNL